MVQSAVIETAVISLILPRRLQFPADSFHGPLLAFIQCHRGSGLPTRPPLRSWVDHVGIDGVGRMKALALCLIKRHEKELGTIQVALHLRCYIRVPICTSVDPTDQDEYLIFE